MAIQKPNVLIATMVVGVVRNGKIVAIVVNVNVIRLAMNTPAPPFKR